MGCEIMPSRCEVLYRVKSGQCEGFFAVSPVPTVFGRDYALSAIMPGKGAKGEGWHKGCIDRKRARWGRRAVEGSVARCLLPYGQFAKAPPRAH